MTLPQHESTEQQQTNDERNERPRGPPGCATLDQRVDDCGQRRPDQHDADFVESNSRMRDCSWQYAERTDEGDNADRHVNEEHQSPSDSPQVGLHQGAGKNRRGKDRQPHAGPECAQDLAHFVLVEDFFDHSESLGNH